MVPLVECHFDYFPAATTTTFLSLVAAAALLMMIQSLVMTIWIYYYYLTVTSITVAKFFFLSLYVCVCGNYLVKGEYLCIKKRKISTGGLLLLSNFPNAVHKLISFFFFLCVYFFVGR